MSITVITRTFVVYKLVLLSVLFLVLREYDTSSKLILTPVHGSLVVTALARLAQKTMIWDSVFYVSAAVRGIRYEHEWAFGCGWSGLIGAVASRWPVNTLDQLFPVPEYTYTLTSVALTTLSHYLATLALYHLTMLTFASQTNVRRLARTTALLYVFSPGGLFLIAGYPEATFALVSFLGLIARHHQHYILAGLLFACSCGLRSNGLLWGLVMLVDLYGAMGDMVNTRNLYRPLCIIVGGSLIALAVLGLQVYPYWLYCPGREWCDHAIPSIYSYVQAKYWNVGFLRYWTPNNATNFVFAAPTLALIFGSLHYFKDHPLFKNLSGVLLVQLVLASAAVIVYHVQIITRLATSLPAVYWYVASLGTSTSLRQATRSRTVLTYFWAWAVVQAVLFSAFLPPA